MNYSIIKTGYVNLRKKIYLIKSMMEFISSEQEKIVNDRSKIRKVSGCAGSRKTDTMIKCGI